ncbi:hypothetical protein ACFE04_021101 [Oxalis oulophora]
MDPLIIMSYLAVFLAVFVIGLTCYFIRLVMGVRASFSTESLPVHGIRTSNFHFSPIYAASPELSPIYPIFSPELSPIYPISSPEFYLSGVSTTATPGTSFTCVKENNHVQWNAGQTLLSEASSSLQPKDQLRHLYNQWHLEQEENQAAAPSLRSPASNNINIFELMHSGEVPSKKYHFATFDPSIFGKYLRTKM